MAELSVRILPSEAPFDGALLLVALALPSVDFRLQSLSAGNTPIQALTAEDPDLYLCHVQPTCMLGRVVELHPAQQFGRGALTQDIFEALSEMRVQALSSTKCTRLAFA